MTPLNRLAGKAAIVTGATAGIGLASVERFIEEGATVFAVARGVERLDELAARLGQSLIPIVGDVGREDDLDGVFATVAASGLGLDIVFANAGAAVPGMLGTIRTEDYRRMFDVTVLGALLTVQKALPLMRDGGSIILMGSIAGSKGRPGRSIYSASKATLRSFARSWASDLAGRNIRVNVLSAGPTDTGSFANASDAVRAQMAALTLRGRLGEPREIAAAAAFLASDDAAFVNGSELFADGGAAQV
jgi:NAD(P)-dependent dehydrogenase (short-subunit alcohol dehydrogenase family)